MIYIALFNITLLSMMTSAKSTVDTRSTVTVKAIEFSNDTIAPTVYDRSLRYGIDSTVNPCDDFYQYVNGGWRRAAVLPKKRDKRAEFQVFLGIETAVPNVYKQLVDIVDSAQLNPNGTESTTLRVIMTFYQSCMQADTLESSRYARLRKGALDASATMSQDSSRKDQCTQRVFHHMGGAVGQIFVEKLKNSTSAARVNSIVAMILKETMKATASNKLLSEKQKIIASEALTRLKLRVGIPEHTVDYSGLQLSRSEYYNNIAKIKNYSHHTWVQSIGSMAKDEWLFGLLRANANYIPSQHAIEIPPVWFFPPFFYDGNDDALNFAAAGWVIGHEIYHSVVASIDTGEKKISIAMDSFRQFNSSLGVLDGWGTNGAISWSEDIADLGGGRVAYAAWKNAMKSSKEEADKDSEGFTPDQRFFISMGRVWRAKWEGKATIGVHAAPFARVNATVMQIPAFAKAFGCKAGDRMYLSPDQISQIW